MRKEEEEEEECVDGHDEAGAGQRQRTDLESPMVVWLRRFDAPPAETPRRMDESQNVAGTRLTCSNPDCDCELQINRPCPHGTTYTCACGHPLEPAS
jgi:hypothetical protein